MPSPFPGMDPYLENPIRWAGVHLNLISGIQAELNRQLPDGIVAEIDQYVWVTDDAGDRELLGNPDTFVTGPHQANGAYPADPAGVAAPTATTTMSARAVRRTRVVRIVSAEDARVLTVIEVLSPSNKNGGENREAYLAKRREYFAARSNLVEIDLLRDGDRLPMGRPRPPVSDYHVLVTRAGEYPRARVWTFGIREPFPTVPVPVNRTTAAVGLNLRPCLDRVYDEGRFVGKVDYDAPATPPLDRAGAEWAAELLAKQAKKKKR